ncbi:MAG: hypothetical protein FJX44_05795 [Alphaproteobacteria bacterium]|nr:hypothetical protein [Alphaproteobacteria bacterium]
MDQSSLVASGHQLIDVLTKAGIGPRAAVWVHNTDTDTWRLWIVPPEEITDKRDFYRRVSEVISKNRANLPNLNISDTEFITADNRVIQALRRIFRVKEFGAIMISSTMFNGVQLPDGIILLMDF